jgi:hypothetical protein
MLRVSQSKRAVEPNLLVIKSKHSKVAFQIRERRVLELAACYRQRMEGGKVTIKPFVRPVD